MRRGRARTEGQMQRKNLTQPNVVRVWGYPVAHPRSKESFLNPLGGRVTCKELCFRECDEKQNNHRAP